MLYQKLSILFICLTLIFIFYQEILNHADRLVYGKLRKKTVRSFCRECITKNVEKKQELSDKYLVKEYFKNNNYKNLKTTKTILKTKNLDEIKNFDFGEKYLVKSTYGSHRNLLVDKKTSMKNIMESTKNWLRDKWHHSDEPQYKYEYNNIIIEEFINIDYEIKSIVVKGNIIFHYAFQEGGSTVYYDQEKKLIEDIMFSEKLTRKIKNTRTEIPEIEDKLTIVEESINKFYLETGFDFFRFDVYVTKEGDVYLGEITFTPERCRFKLPNYYYNTKIYDNYVK